MSGIRSLQVSLFLLLCERRKRREEREKRKEVIQFSSRSSTSSLSLYPLSPLDWFLMYEHYFPLSIRPTIVIPFFIYPKQIEVWRRV